jgi:benzylsuccinate CoA-transferase BbsF subunit
VRVESSRRPDLLRLLPGGPGLPEGVDASPVFALLNAGKRSVALDLQQAEGAALAERLVDWADVVVESFAPGVRERLGLAPARWLERRPEVIVLSIGPLGPMEAPRDDPGFGGHGSAIAGFDHLTGWPDREALGPYGAITDSLASRYAAALLSAALLARAQTGRGQHLEVSTVEVGVHALSELVVRWTGAGESLGRAGNRSERAAPHGVYPCDGDDAWIAIAVQEDGEWDALVAAMGDPPWAAEPRFASLAARLAHADELDRRVADWTRAFAPYELMAGLQDAGVPAGVVQRPEALLRDPQLAHRGHFVRVEHAVLGTLFVERSGLRLAAHPGGFASAGPLLGEHTDTVLRELLGLPAEEIARLRERGILS